MAWEWSHTGEAYAAAEENLRALDLETLREIYAEWAAHAPGGFYDDSGYHGDDFDHHAYQEAQQEAEGMYRDVLADWIWSKACELRTCDNGGHRAWTCPYGCEVHTVSFTREEMTDVA